MGKYRIGKGRRIADRRVDTAVLACVEEQLSSDTAIKHVLAALQKEQDAAADSRSLTDAEKRLGPLTKKLGKMVDLIAEAESEGERAAIRRRMSEIESERAALLTKVAELRAARDAAQAAKEFTPEMVRHSLAGLFGEFTSTNSEGVRGVLDSVIERIELNPETDNIQIYFRVSSPAVTGIVVASPPGFEPGLSP